MAAVRPYIQQQPILYVRAGELLRKREAFIYMHMIAKGQMKSDGGRHRSVAEQFYDLAKYVFLFVLSHLLLVSLLRQNRFAHAGGGLLSPDLTSLDRTSAIAHFSCPAADRNIAR
jgi:hypothetical protein